MDIWHKLNEHKMFSWRPECHMSVMYVMTSWMSYECHVRHDVLNVIWVSCTLNLSHILIGWVHWSNIFVDDFWFSLILTSKVNQRGMANLCDMSVNCNKHLWYILDLKDNLVWLAKKRAESSLVTNKKYFNKKISSKNYL